MNTLLKDTRQLSGKNLWSMLDDEYRDFHMMSSASFPPDEFDGNEQRLLAKLLRALERWGYSRVFRRLSCSEAGRRIIDTAAGYGEFVDSKACASYLGVFIAAEAVQYPFAMDSYARPMVRSDCFRMLDHDAKAEVLSLMHLARFVREIDLSDELSLDMYAVYDRTDYCKVAGTQG